MKYSCCFGRVIRGMREVWPVPSIFNLDASKPRAFNYIASQKKMTGFLPDSSVIIFYY